MTTPMWTGSMMLLKPSQKGWKASLFCNILNPTFHRPYIFLNSFAARFVVGVIRTRRPVCWLRMEVDMPFWNLMCANCASTFVHRAIEDADSVSFLSPQKPDLPPGGSEVKCPNCGQNATYDRTSLIYSA